MEAKVFEQFRYNLVEKRQTLTDWLSTASARKKQARLGPADEGAGRTGLFPGDTLLLYTDGVTEATNRQYEEFGEERLAELVRRESGSSAKALVRGLRGALEAFSDGRPLSDDTTIIACKVAES